jgi:hypothetical protein
MRRTVNLKTSFLLAAAATLALPLPLMRLSTPALTVEVSFIFVVEAAPVAFAAEVSFP